MAWYDEYIEQVEGIQGGFPIVRGTRTPIRSIIEESRMASGSIDEVRRAMPHLSVIEVEAALAYYRDHPQLVDADIERQRVALEQFLASR